MFCPKCGAQIPAGSNTCPQCQASTGSSGNAPPPSGDYPADFFGHIKALFGPAALPPPSPTIDALRNSPPKNYIIFIILAIFLGGLGIHNFYAGYRDRGLAELVLWLVLTCISCGALGLLCWVYVIIDIIYIKQDAAGRPFV